MYIRRWRAWFPFHIYIYLYVFITTRKKHKQTEKNIIYNGFSIYGLKTIVNSVFFCFFLVFSGPEIKKPLQILLFSAFSMFSAVCVCVGGGGWGLLCTVIPSASHENIEKAEKSRIYNGFLISAPEKTRKKQKKAEFTMVFQHMV